MTGPQATDGERPDDETAANAVGGGLGPAGTRGPGDGERQARLELSFLTDSGEPAIGALLRYWAPEEVLEAVRSGAGVLRGGGDLPEIPGLGRAVKRWHTRLPELPTPARRAVWAGSDLRFLCPGDPGWPSQLDDLGDSQPLVLWARGQADLRFACLNAVSVVGSRAATAYGTHVGMELAAGLAERGLTVVSGGAFGIDSAAHRGALAADGLTVAVLASGLHYLYPRGQHALFAAITAQGVLVSECPPDRAPTRPGFLIRNRIIAALSRGTVVVEAALRSGAQSTARHARELRRPLMAVPGPVTSEQSAGCHELIRQGAALCVTGVADVLEHVSPVGSELTGPRFGAATPRDRLDPATTAVLEAVPARGGRGPAGIAVRAGVSLDTALRCLGLLAAAGFVQRCDTGWQRRKEA